jgi:hypothetical protein
VFVFACILVETCVCLSRKSARRRGIEKRNDRKCKEVRGLVLYHESDEGDDKIAQEREEK